MNPIVSGSTTERIVRTVFATILFSGYSSWLLWDGYVGYPKQNMQSALINKIGVEPSDPLPVSDSKFTAKYFETLSENLTVDVILEQLGEPHFKHMQKLYYFGDAGFMTIQVGQSNIANLRWNEGPRYRQLDITLQRIFGLCLIPIGLGFFIQLVRVLRTRVELNDSGLHIRGKPSISFDQIRSMVEPDSESKSSCVELHYEQNGEEKNILLDPYVVKKLPEITKVIREKLL